MGCRIGITTDPQERRREWQSRYPSLRNWLILGTHFYRASAQLQEDRHAGRFGCEAHPGGRGAEIAKWYVYHFEY